MPSYTAKISGNKRYRETTTCKACSLLYRSSKKGSILLENSLIGRASRAIATPATIAKPTKETLQLLEEKHSIGSPNSFNPKTSPSTTRPIVAEDIIEAISTFSKDTTSGIDGWTLPLLKLVIEKGRALELMLLLANQASKGLAKGPELLLVSRLIPMDKDTGGIKPIAIGNLIYRLITKSILKAFFTEDSLLPCQLGVGSKLGVDPAIALLDSALKSGDYTKITSLDLKNALNSIPRPIIASQLPSHTS